MLTPMNAGLENMKDKDKKESKQQKDPTVFGQVWNQTSLGQRSEIGTFQG